MKKFRHLHAVSLEKLKKEIEKGLDSWEPIRLDVEAIKTRGREGPAIQQQKVES